MGGEENLSSGSHSRAGGYRAKAENYGEDAYAAGWFAVQGDAQISRMVARRVTTDATPTELRLDGSSQQAIIPTGGTMGFTIYVLGKDVASGDCARYRLDGVGRRHTSTTGALVGTAEKTVLAEDTAAAAWDVDVTVTSAGVISVKATGEAGKTIRWLARMETEKIA